MSDTLEVAMQRNEHYIWLWQACPQSITMYSVIDILEGCVVIEIDVALYLVRSSAGVW